MYCTTLLMSLGPPTMWLQKHVACLAKTKLYSSREARSFTPHFHWAGPAECLMKKWREMSGFMRLDLQHVWPHHN